MSALYVASHPKPVREAIERHRRALDANPILYLNENNRPLVGESRSAAADYLELSSASDIALTDSTTMGIGLVYNGLRLGSGDEMLTTEHDYYATHEALRLASERKGATARRAVLYDDVMQTTEDELVDRLVAEVSAQTRVVALTWVHSSTGLKLPVARIGEELRRINEERSDDERVLLCIDGVHGFGVEDLALPELGCDFFMAGCHKWLFGPRGTGILWGSEAGMRRCLPTVPSFLDDGSRGAWIDGTEVTGRSDGARMSPGGFKPFEHQWALAEAFRFCAGIGKARIAERTHALARQLKEGLAQMQHVTLRTPMAEALSSGIVCFEIDGMGPWAAVDRLLERHNLIATVTPYASRYVRLAPSIRNSPDEVDAALAAIHDLG
jgi:isopenicillin-N epimerase